ncbi:MAG TPA: type II secretion system protein [Burkholderiaceae bacterium]|nr:type II secretion system protein [Burkholderiaceae bacterium]
MNKQAMHTVRPSAQAGFTLIELIVVIVILGILAATALPRFANLGGDARRASMQAAQGALSTTVSMVHGQFLLNPATVTANGVTNEGQTVNVVNGYPAANEATATAAGLTANDYLILTTAGPATATQPIVPANSIVVIPNSIQGTAASLNCFLTYTQAAVNGAPTIQLTANGATACQ